MANIIDSFQLTFRDFETPNLPSSGQRKVWKADARALGGVIEQAVNLIANGVVIGSATLYATKAARDADYATGPVGRLALVYADPTPANNTISVKGASAWADAGMTLAASAVAQLADFSARITALEAIAGLFPYAVADAAGTFDALVLNPTPALTALKNGSYVYFRVNGPNTGAVTINVSGLGVKDLRGMTGGSLVASDLQAGRVYAARYTGTRWDLVAGSVGEYSLALANISQVRRITLDPSSTSDVLIGTTPGYTGTPTQQLQNGSLLILRPTLTSTTTTPSLQLSGDTVARPIRDASNVALKVGDLIADRDYLILPDGGRYRLLNPGSSMRAADVTAAIAAAVAALVGAATTSGDTLKKLEDRIASEGVTRGLNDAGLQTQITPLTSKLGGIEVGADVTDKENVAAAFAATNTKAAPADADYFTFIDTEASGILRRITWASLRQRFFDLFDTKTAIANAPAKSAPAAGDVLGLLDSANGNLLSKLSWANILTALGSVFQGKTTVLDATTASFTTAKDTKLSGIATGATANATDAALRDRSSHTGTQPVATISGLQTALDAKASTTVLTAEVSRATAAEAALASDVSTALSYVAPYVDLVADVPQRPGDARSLFTSALTGNPKTRATVTKGATADGGALGQALRVSGSDTDPTSGYLDVAPKKVFFIEDGRTYMVHYAFGRAQDPSDPEQNAVELRLQNLSSSFGSVSNVRLGTALAPTVAAGAQNVRFLIGKSGAVGTLAYTIPSTSRYISPHVRIFGNGQQTDVGSINLYDVTDQVAGGADLAVLVSRITAAEAATAAAQTAANEALLAKTRRLTLDSASTGNLIIGQTSGSAITAAEIRVNNAIMLYRPTLANTGAVLARINGDTSDRPVYDMNNNALRAGDFEAGKDYVIFGEGQRYRCLNPGAGTPRVADITAAAAKADIVQRTRFESFPADDPDSWTAQVTVDWRIATPVLPTTGYALGDTVAGKALLINGSLAAGPIAFQYLAPGRVYRYRVGMIRTIDDVGGDTFNRFVIRARSFDANQTGFATTNLTATLLQKAADGFQEYSVVVSRDPAKSSVTLPTGTVYMRGYPAGGQGVTTGQVGILYFAFDDITDSGFSSATPVTDPANLDFLTRDAGGAPRTLSTADLEAWIKQMAVGPDLYPHDIVKETIGSDEGRVIIPSAPEVYSVFIQNLSDDADAEIGMVDGDKSLAAMTDAKWKISRLGYVELESPKDFVPGAFSIISNKEGTRFSCHFTTTTPDNPIFTVGASQAAEEHLARYSGSMTTGQRTAVFNRFRTLWLLGIIQKARAAGATLLTARAPNLTDSLLDWARPANVASVFGSPSHVAWSNWAFDGTDDYIETNVGFSGGVTAGDHTGYVEIGPETHTSAQIAAGSQRLRLSVNHLSGTRMRVTDFSANMATSGNQYADIYYNPEHTPGGGGHVFASRNDAINTIATFKKTDFIVSSALDYTDAYTFKVGAGSSTGNVPVSFYPGPIYGAGITPFLTKTQRDGLVDADAAFVAALAGG